MAKQSDHDFKQDQLDLFRQHADAEIIEISAVTVTVWIDNNNGDAVLFITRSATQPSDYRTIGLTLTEKQKRRLLTF